MRKEIWSQPALEAWILRFFELLCSCAKKRNPTPNMRIASVYMREIWYRRPSLGNRYHVHWKNLSSLQTSGRSKSGTMSQQRQESSALLHCISLLWHSNAFSRSSAGQNPGRSVSPENNEPTGHLHRAQTLKPVWESELNEHHWLRRKLNLLYNWDLQHISKGGPKTAWP